MCIRDSIVGAETERGAVDDSQFGESVAVVVVSLTIAYHAEQVDSGVSLLVDDSPVEGGHVVEAIAVDGG